MKCFIVVKFSKFVRFVPSNSLYIWMFIHSFKYFNQADGENSPFPVAHILECHVRLPVRASKRRAAGKDIPVR